MPQLNLERSVAAPAGASGGAKSRDVPYEPASAMARAVRNTVRKDKSIVALSHVFATCHFSRMNCTFVTLRLKQRLNSTKGIGK